jgi:S1-C subfamily serine protease
MDILDAVILILLVAFAISGYRRGFTWGGSALAGLVVGSVVGALIAPPLTRWISPGSQSSGQPLLAAGIFVAALLIIEGIGSALGYRARVLALKTRLAVWDSVAGSVTSCLGLLFIAWFLGFTFANSSLAVVSSQIGGSAIERGLLDIAPQPPAFLAKVQGFLQNNELPNPFTGLSPTLPLEPLPASTDTAGVRAAEADVSRVIAYGCGGPGGAVAGSAWPVGNALVLTNAHVVAGSSQQTVQPPGRQPLNARVVLFDPNEDVAILYVPGLGMSPLPIASGNPPVGAQGAVIGYPDGGSEATVAAAVRGTELATTWNIYYSASVTRETVVASANVIPGDSGGPLVDLSGRVIGVTFAMSTTSADEGYALATSDLSGEIQAATGHTAAVSDGACVTD